MQSQIFYGHGLRFAILLYSFFWGRWGGGFRGRWWREGVGDLGVWVLGLGLEHLVEKEKW